MRKNEFELFLQRDNYRCYHCGRSDDTLVPQHRLGRGMGGKNSKANKLSNIITLCSFANGLIESDADFADEARRSGWKLSSFQDPTAVSVYDFFSSSWFLLDNAGNRAETAPKNCP
jgi:hypothetical protein